MITRARFVGICVSDQQRALDFYTWKLGFDKIMDAPLTPDNPSGPRWIMVAPPGAQAPFVLFTPPGQEDRVGGFQNITFECDDIKATYEQLSAKRVEFTQPPSEQPWGWWAQFKDSEGNEFGLGLGGPLSAR